MNIIWSDFEVIEVDILELVYVLGLNSHWEKNKTLLFLDGQFTIEIVLIENRVEFFHFIPMIEGKNYWDDV